MPEITEDTSRLWTNALTNLKGQVNEQVFNAWFNPIKPLSVDNKSINLGVPNEFFKEWVTERYFSLLKSCINSTAGRELEIVFILLPQSETGEVIESQKAAVEKQEKRGLFRSIFPKQTSEQQLRQTGLNPKYTFDMFVVGPSNRFAHAASLAISESPAKTYNPLFIYGGVGLGKTHLMHAIGNYILQKFQKKTILYISSEEFTNQLINAIQTRSTQKFRLKYRNVDVILIDDIHFIAGKEATQEEFFHTFNALYDAHKQIIISSDRSPKEIPTLEERLVSRFGWGLVTDIQPPDFETRVAILKKKSEKETLPMPDDVFYFLGEHIKTNIRELEGALIRVVAYAKLTGKHVSVDLAKEVLKGMFIESEKRISVDLIQKKVVEFYNISLQDMKNKKRTQGVTYPRQVAMYLSRNLTNLSLLEIGSYFGGRDHSTVLHACNKIEVDIKNKSDVSRSIERLILNVKG